MLANQNIEKLYNFAQNIDFGMHQSKVIQVITKKIDPVFNQDIKLNNLLDSNVKGFNQLVFEYLKTTEYPLSTEKTFPLIENDEVLIRKDIFKILEELVVVVHA